MSENLNSGPIPAAESAVQKNLGQKRLGSVCSNESFEANLGDDTQEGALVGFLERLNPAIAHRNAVLRKPGTKRTIYVDEIDEECVSMKCIPRGLIRGRSVGVADHHGEDLMTQAQLRTASEMERAQFGNDEYDEDKEFTAYELARRICPERFYRFRRVGAVPLQLEEPQVPKNNSETVTGEGDAESTEVDAEDVVDDEEEYEYDEYEEEYEDGDEDWYEHYAEDGQTSEEEQSTEVEAETEGKLERKWSDEVFDVEAKFGRGADRVERLHDKIKGYGYRGYGMHDGTFGTRSFFL